MISKVVILGGALLFALGVELLLHGVGGVAFLGDFGADPEVVFGGDEGVGAVVFGDLGATA